MIAVLIIQAHLQMHVYTSTSALEHREFVEEFLLELMMLDDVPMDTRYVFIDPSWVACEAHAKQSSNARKLGFATAAVASCIVGLVYLLLELNLNYYREFRST